MRYTFNELKAQILARLPDNNSGIITPAVLRGVLIDFVDSVQSSHVGFTHINQQAVQVGNVLATPAIPIFDEKTESGALELSGDLLTQTITSHIRAAYVFNVSIVVAGPVDTLMTLGLIIDGTPYPFSQAQGILPANDAPLTLSANGVVTLMAGQKVQCGLRADSASPIPILAGPSGMVLRLIPARD